MDFEEWQAEIKFKRDMEIRWWELYPNLEERMTAYLNHIGKQELIEFYTQ